MFLLAFLDTFIIDSSMGRDRHWQRTWRVVGLRSPDMSAFTTYNRIGVDRHRQTIEPLCVMVSIIGQGIANISKGDTFRDSHEDEHGGLPTVISMTQEQLVGIGSDKIPSLPWDSRVHFVSRLFHFMMT
jgi:hypothetical protein